ncbi:Unknown protein, partial [Striga hermonthica]
SGGNPISSSQKPFYHHCKSSFARKKGCAELLWLGGSKKKCVRIPCWFGYLCSNTLYLNGTYSMQIKTVPPLLEPLLQRPAQ